MIGLNPNNKIKDRNRLDNRTGSTHELSYIDFGCLPMIQDLRNLGYASSKTVRKEIPYLMDRNLFLAWLLGFYDGDGSQDTTLIYSASKVFLEQIKNKLGLGWEVKEIKRPQKNYYYLRLGAEIFNEMMRNYQYSMKRKRRKFREDSFEILKEKVSKDEIQDLIYKYPKYKIEQKLNVNYRVLQRLIEEWNIKEPINRTQALRELLEEKPNISYEEARKRIPQLGYKLFLNVRGEWRRKYNN